MSLKLDFFFPPLLEFSALLNNDFFPPGPSFFCEKTKKQKRFTKKKQRWRSSRNTVSNKLAKYTAVRLIHVGDPFI